MLAYGTTGEEDRPRIPLTFVQNLRKTKPLCLRAKTMCSPRFAATIEVIRSLRFHLCSQPSNDCLCTLWTRTKHRNCSVWMVALCVEQLFVHHVLSVVLAAVGCLFHVMTCVHDLDNRIQHLHDVVNQPNVLTQCTNDFANDVASALSMLSAKTAQVIDTLAT